MNAAAGVVDLACSHSVADTADRLESALGGKGIQLFARIDQAAAAHAVGLNMRPMVLIIFGDPKVGTPLMEKYPTLAIDLPLKALMWERADGKVFLSFNSPAYLKERHGMEAEPFGPLVGLLKAVAGE